jgi:hypothetical protein
MEIRRRRALSAAVAISALVVAVLAGPAGPAQAQQGCTGSGVGIATWQLRWASGGVTLCKGVDANGVLAAYVTIVDQSLGAKMRIVSTVAAGQARGQSETRFDRRTVEAWYNNMGSFIGNPSSSKLFSVTNGAFFVDTSNPNTPLSLPEKTGNSSSSLGYALTHHADAAWAAPKREFAVSTPGQTPQGALISGFPTSYSATDAALGNVWEGVVGFLPTYTVPGSAVFAKRTFVGWTPSTSRVYLLTTWANYTTTQANDILASYGAQLTMQLDGGGSTAMNSPRTFECIGCGGRPVPEVLAVFTS